MACSDWICCSLKFFGVFRFDLWSTGHFINMSCCFVFIFVASLFVNCLVSGWSAVWFEWIFKTCDDHQTTVWRNNNRTNEKKKTKLNGTVCGFELDNGKWMSNRFVFGMAHFASFICSFNFRAFMYTFGGDLVSNWIVSQPTKIKNTTSKGGCQHLSQLLLIWNGNWLWSDRNVCRLTSYQ